MKVIQCPKCHQETEILLNDAVDELGEVYICKHCGYKFRYVEE